MQSFKRLGCALEVPYTIKTFGPPSTSLSLSLSLSYPRETLRVSHTRESPVPKLDLAKLGGPYVSRGSSSIKILLIHLKKGYDLNLPNEP